MANLFDVNLVCLDGGDQFMDGNGDRLTRDAEGVQELTTADFIRTPVSANDQIDIAEMGGVIDFDLDDDNNSDENNSEEDEARGGISDNDDSDDTAPAVEETPKHDFAYRSQIMEPLAKPTGYNTSMGPVCTDVNSNTLSSSPLIRSIPGIPQHLPATPKRAWHVEMLESIIGPPRYRYPTTTVPPASGSAMTYEEALSRRPTRRHTRRPS
jgi:hypothetical protein